MPWKGNSSQPHFIHSVCYFCLGSRFPSGATFLPVPTGAAQPLLPLSHNVKQISCAGPPYCPADCEESDLSFKADLGKGHSSSAKLSANTYSVHGKPVCTVKVRALTVSKTHGLGPEGCWTFSDLTWESLAKAVQIWTHSTVDDEQLWVFSFLWIFKISEILFIFFLIFWKNLWILNCTINTQLSAPDF